MDDEPFNLIPLQRLATENALTCDLAYNGREALEKVEQKFSSQNGEFNYYKLIFMDIQMPIMDGLQCTKQVGPCITISLDNSLL